MGTRQTFEQITPRQREVLDLLAANRTNFEIAQELGISLDGAKWHVREVLARLGVDSREQAGEYWRRERSLVRRAIAFLMPVAQLATSKVAVFAGVALVSGAVVAGAFALRGGDDESGSEAEVLASPSAAAVIDDLAPRSDIPIVDEVIAAGRAGDLPAIRDLMLAFAEPCTTGERGVGSPPGCPAGASDGTPVDTLRVIASERVDPGPDLDQLLENVVPKATTLHAVIRSQPNPWGGTIPPARYEVFFFGSGGAPQTWVVYFLNDSGIVGVYVPDGFGGTDRLANLDSTDWIIAPNSVPRFSFDKPLYVLGRDREMRIEMRTPPACAGRTLAIRLYGYPDPGVDGGIQSITEPGLSTEARAVADASGQTSMTFRLPATASGPLVVRGGLLSPCLSSIAVQNESHLALQAASEDAEVAVVEVLGQLLDRPNASAGTIGEYLGGRLIATVGGVVCATVSTVDPAVRNARGNVVFRIGTSDQPAACRAPGKQIEFVAPYQDGPGAYLSPRPVFVPGAVQLMRNYGPDAPHSPTPPPELTGGR
jgi:DNA-binding CsgD family transcriptional regulator